MARWGGDAKAAGLESVIVNTPGDLSNDSTVAPSLPSWRVTLGLLALILLAATLRARHMSEPLWVDELHTAWVVEGSLADVADRAAVGNQGPLFFYAQWFLCSLLTPSELTYRCLSLVAGLLLVPTVFFVAREICGSDWAGWTAAAMISVDRFSVIFSCEARPYAWVQWVTVVHLYLGWLRLTASYQPASKPSPRLRLAWIGSGALLFYLHYTAALILCAEVVAWVVLRLRYRGLARPDRSLGTIDLVGLAVVCSPALPHLMMINHRRTNWTEFVPMPTILSLLTLLPLLVYVGLPLAARLTESVTGKEVSRNRGRAVWLTMLCCCLLFPLLVTWVTTVSGMAALYLTRYLIGSLTVSVLIAATLLGRLQGDGRRWVTAIVLAVVVLLTESAISFSRWVPANGAWPPFLHRSGVRAKQEDWRSLISHVNEQDPAGRWPVFLVPDLIEDRQLGQSQAPPLHARISREEFCLFPLQGCYPLRRSRVPPVALASKPAVLQDQYLDRLKMAGGGWFIVRGSRSRVQGWQQAIDKALARDGPGPRSELQRFGSLGLVRVQSLPIQ